MPRHLYIKKMNEQFFTEISIFLGIVISAYYILRAILVNISKVVKTAIKIKETHESIQEHEKRFEKLENKIDSIEKTVLKIHEWLVNKK